MRSFSMSEWRKEPENLRFHDGRESNHYIDRQDHIIAKFPYLDPHAYYEDEFYLLRLVPLETQ